MTHWLEHCFKHFQVVDSNPVLTYFSPIYFLVEWTSAISPRYDHCPSYTTQLNYSIHREETRPEQNVIVPMIKAVSLLRHDQAVELITSQNIAR